MLTNIGARRICIAAVVAASAPPMCVGIRRLLLLASALLVINVALFGTVSLAAAGNSCDPRQLIVDLAQFGVPDSVRQIVVVASDSWSSAVGILNKFEFRDGRWCEVDAAFPVVLGRRGSAWGYGLHRAVALGPQKEDGDGRVPAGIFRLGPAFGYDKDLEPVLQFPYRQSTGEDYFIDDVTSADYNTWVRLPEGANEPKAHWKSFEVMRRSDNLYKLGIVVQQNTAPVIRGHGSAIFFHVWRSSTTPTAGGIGLRESNLRRMIDWLTPNANPILVVAPRGELAKLRFNPF
jgi:L,D-peptidoglycan transpeptidase YkuD (ErfK/YbiS/YcfS/YnhG family)